MTIMTHHDPPVSLDPKTKRNAVYSFQRPSEPALIRGSLFQPLPQFVKARFGEHRWDEFLRRVDPVAADALRGEMQALAWYPFLVVASAVDAMVAMSTEGTADATLQKLSAHNLDRATNLIFRAIFRVGSPEFMVSKSDQVWKKYYSTGRMVVEEAARGRACVRLYDFPQITRAYSRVVLYAVEAVIQKAGGHTTYREVTRDVNAGDEFSEFSYAWTV
jgi:hypothetical protein